MKSSWYGDTASSMEVQTVPVEHLEALKEILEQNRLILELICNPLVFVKGAVDGPT